MSGWKEKMVKIKVGGIILLGGFVLLSPRVFAARKALADGGQYNLIIEDALNEIERNLNAVLEKEGRPSDEDVIEIPEVNIAKDVLSKGDRQKEEDVGGETRPAVVTETKAGILLQTETFRLKHVRVDDVIGRIEELLTKNIGQLQRSDEENKIVVTDTPSKIGKIQQLLNEQDCLDTKISIKTKVLQIILNDEHLMGVDWEAIVSGYKKLEFSSDVSDDSGKKEFLSVGSVSDEDYAILLEALDTVGMVKLISDQQILMEDGTARAIDDSVPVSIQTAGERAVRFRVKPIVRDDGLLTVSVGLEPVEGEAGPGKASEEEVTVELKSGATVVIGGLFDQTILESISKVPLLGNLPVLGFVFRSQDKEVRKAEVITFLTFKVMEKDPSF